MVDAFFGGHAVDDVEGVGVVGCADTADADFGVGAGLARVGDDLHAGDFAFESVLDVGGVATVEVVGRDAAHGRRHYGFFLDAVTYYYHFVEGGGVFGKSDIESVGVVGYLDFLRLASNIGEYECVSGLASDGIVAVDVGYNSFCGAFYSDRDADKRFGLRVG